MDRLHHQCPLQWLTERANTRESKPCGTIGRVARIPHHVDIIANRGNPVKSEIDIHALILVVGLQQQENAGPSARRILDSRGGLHGCKAAFWEVHCTSGDARAQDDSPARSPSRVEIDLGIGAAVEVAETHERCQAEAAAGRDRVLQLPARPPIPARWNGHGPEHLEWSRWCVEKALNVDLEMVAVLEIAPEWSPFEFGSLPIAAPQGRATFIGDDVPAWNLDVELPDTEHLRPRHEVDVPCRFPNPGAPDKAEGRGEASVDTVERHEVVEQVVGIVGCNAPGLGGPC